VSLFTLAVDANGVPPSPGEPSTEITVPTTAPVAGSTVGFFAGRVYASSGTIFDENTLTIIFAGYHTPKPKNGLGDYRIIRRVSLHSSEPLRGGYDSGGDEQ
jgi:hypothetical protein